MTDPSAELARDQTTFWFDRVNPYDLTKFFPALQVLLAAALPALPAPCDHETQRSLAGGGLVEASPTASADAIPSSTIDYGRACSEIDFHNLQHYQ